MFRQRLGNAETGLAVEEQNAGIVEKMAQFGLGMAHRPFLQNTPQASTGSDGLVRHTGFQPRGIRVLKLLPPYLVMVVDHAQADGICLFTHRIQNGLGTVQVTIAPHPDRKSTRLNSSHVRISYAVFCLKKKKHTTTLPRLTLRSRGGRPPRPTSARPPPRPMSPPARLRRTLSPRHPPVPRPLPSIRLPR